LSVVAARELEEDARKYASEAIRLDSQGAHGMAIQMYQRAISTLIKLVHLYPEYHLNRQYLERATVYHERVKAIQQAHGLIPQDQPSEELPVEGTTNVQVGGNTKGPQVVQQLKASFSELVIKEKPEVKWDDVIGLEDCKGAIRESIVFPFLRPDLFKLGWPRGILLFGPPGCGKTFIARATAGELGARFLGIGLSDILDMWLGQSEHRLHELFENARRNAPCVLFFDELDAIGQKRVQLQHHGSMRNVVNQLLQELDGVDSNNEGVFVLGATNHPWDVDTAFLRPGRFDRILVVVPPDEPARLAILQHHVKGRPVEGVDLRAMAARTDGFSGADLAHLCETATENALEQSVQTGVMRSITSADFQDALRQVRPSTRPWFETARNFVLFGNESGAYDELMAYMKTKKLL